MLTNDFDFAAAPGGQREASTGLWPSPARVPLQGMDDHDRPIGPETMR